MHSMQEVSCRDTRSVMHFCIVVVQHLDIWLAVRLMHGCAFGFKLLLVFLIFFFSLLNLSLTWSLSFTSPRRPPPSLPTATDSSSLNQPHLLFSPSLFLFPLAHLPHSLSRFLVDRPSPPLSPPHFLLVTAAFTPRQRPLPSPPPNCPLLPPNSSISNPHPQIDSFGLNWLP